MRVQINVHVHVHRQKAFLLHVYIWLFALATKQSLPSVFFALQGLGPHPNKASRSRTLAAGVVWWATSVSIFFAAQGTHCIHWHCKMRFRALRKVGHENALYIYILCISVHVPIFIPIAYLRKLSRNSALDSAINIIMSVYIFPQTECPH